MSKITNDGLTRSGTGCFIAVPIWNSGRHRVNLLTKMKRRQIYTYQVALELSRNWQFGWSRSISSGRTTSLDL